MIKISARASYLLVPLLLISFIFGINPSNNPIEGASGNVNYIAPNGDNSNSGTLDQPWKTLSYALLQLRPGDTLFIRGGTYKNAVIRLTGENSGLEGEPITVKTFPGEVATLQDGEPLRFNGADWWIIDGLRFINFTHLQFGVHEDLGHNWTDPAEHIIIRNCEFANANETNIRISYGNDILFENNYFHHIRIGVSFSLSGREANALVLQYMANNIRIINNRFEDIGSDGIHINPKERSGSDIGAVEISGNEFWVNRPYNGILGNVGENGIDVKKCRAPILIENKQFHGFRPITPEQDASGAHGDGLIVHGEARNIIIEKNLFYDNTAHLNIAKGSGNGPRDIVIRNNILLETVHSENGGYTVEASALQVRSAVNVQVYHNTFYYTRRYLVSYNVSNCVFKNNIIIGGLADVHPENALWEADYNAWSRTSEPVPGVLHGANDVNTADLGLNRNFHPMPGSRVIDTGENVGVFDDFDGNSRPYGPSYDIGAYEYQSIPIVTTFIDVPSDHWAYEYIEILAAGNYVSGCSINPPMYCPEKTMVRAEGAVFVLRGVNEAGFLPPQPSNQIFNDVLINQWYAKWADELWRTGYTSGCNNKPLEFCPNQEHTRAEGTVFFLRMLHGADYLPPEPTGIFEDVSLDFWGARWIEDAFNAGLIPACEVDANLFCPHDSLTRATAAYIMVQAKGLALPQNR